jgi:hypothetical protein
VPFKASVPPSATIAPLPPKSGGREDAAAENLGVQVQPEQAVDRQTMADVDGECRQSSRAVQRQSSDCRRNIESYRKGKATKVVKADQGGVG